uniref:Ground-like domain-containing protein n=1 Tax=Heterorhabditis bacteriophora TaxID=37862 RepID=A0A1I7XEU5_HETBA
MEKAYLKAKSQGISLCNVQRMATAVQEATQEAFKTSFETIASHKDFVAKVNFAGDLNCKIEVDGKFILAYATPIKEREMIRHIAQINIIDANTFFSDGSDELFDAANGTDSSKPTYIVYGPIRKK